MGKRQITITPLVRRHDSPMEKVNGAKISMTHTMISFSAGANVPIQPAGYDYHGQFLPMLLSDVVFCVSFGRALAV